METKSRTVQAYRKPFLPTAGAKVIGKHILGAAYSGVITKVRVHTMNPDLIEFTIAFDAPTQLGQRNGNMCDDIRTAIITTVDLRGMLNGETRWSGGHGDWFSTLS